MRDGLSADRLARLAGIHKRQVHRARRWLTDRHWITLMNPEEGPRAIPRYRLHLPLRRAVKEVASPLEETLAGQLEPIVPNRP